MRLTHTADLWWKTSVMYCLDVETFRDGDGNGTGDFRGLTEKVDYLDRLGVNCIWLMPFYPTPDRDDGYDIIDYYAVDPRLGTLGDFVEFLRTARDRGIRVIADLVVNHTSDRHPWFESARASRESPYRDWYVWQDEPPADGPEGIVFPDQEDSLWTHDADTGQYYLHRFYRHQPDLNIANPAVRAEIAKIMGFWLQLGLSGFRVDAVPFLLETAGQDDAAALPAPHDYLADLRRFLTRRNGEAILLGEVNLPYDKTVPYFGEGNGDELTMCFDFVGMQQMYLSLARRDAGALAAALRERPAPPRDAHWATFVRNHDELTLDQLPMPERQEVFDAFGPEKSMQLYDRGLRRRLPPMFDGDEQRVRMVYSLLFSLPGTPVLFYGEEIGMSEDLGNDGRMAVRSPMQWTPEAGGGFSEGDPDSFPAPVVTGAYGPEHVNVRAQARNPDSLLSWVRRLAQRYRECPEFAWGGYRVLDTGDPAVLALRYDAEDDSGSGNGGGSDGSGASTVVTLHNLAERVVEVEVRLADLDDGSVLTDLLDDSETPVPEGGTVRLSLDGYGCRWLRATLPDGTAAG